MSGDYSNRGDEALAQIEAEISAHLVRRAQISPDQAKAIAVDIADSIALTFSGEFVYFNKSRANLFRNREIHSALREGATYSELAKRYNLTEHHIRSIQRAMLSADLAKRQVDLFDQPTSTQGD